MADLEFPDWEALYASEPVESMPWFYGALDPDVAEALARQPARGKLLDLGCGSGAQAIAIARLGFEVTATDLAASAVAKARSRARGEGARVTFLQDDIRDTRLEGPFDIVVDRGLLEVLEPSRRAAYAQTVARLLRRGGVFLLKCFSVEDTRDDSPYQFSPEQIGEIFGRHLAVETVRDADYHGTVVPFPRALFCVLRRP